MCEVIQDTLTVKEVQEILKIGTNSAYNLIHSKAFPVIKIGQSYRIPRNAAMPSGYFIQRPESIFF